MSDRSRSASPAREPKPKKQKTSGFKWKEKSARNEDAAQGSRDSGRLERGYRDRSPRRDSYRDREPDRSSRRNDEGGSERKGADSSRPATTSSSAGTSEALDRPKNDDHGRAKDIVDKPVRKEKKEKKPKAAPVSNEPMIVVSINDRLGTKAAIPCLASDSIKAFKAVVAAHIGRQPHEIMLKRQGERPFKDVLTLQDYGVSNGVQLDLELDTGD
ncbi:hypothetical protein LTR36_005734 [Oleoguttula mirabilis]|uniref:Ubiquitin-like modifier HUB1 n=1 Tax=Oleoguttula mirabilis TaxID=1507867 RepID=A0AAV9JDG1_9PEZI|nr:hypothetical protein LTR36_005734 [Oleoguttula mirabilis]